MAHNHISGENKPLNLVQIRSRRTEENARIEQYHRLRDRLAEKRGREYWRSLEELADTPEFHDYLANEFPEQAAEWSDPVGRRTFLKLMGASLALAGVSACAYQPRETILPYIRQPEELVPGKPLFFATAATIAGNTTGLLIRSNEGRPTKIEGNPEHPASLGATDRFAQAEILTLYDPDRSQTINNRGDTSTWSNFLGAARTALEGQRERGGTGLRILTETITSPTLAAQINAMLREFPQAKWRQYDAAGGGDNAMQGAIQAFGRPVNTVYRIQGARRILSIDSDFLTRGQGTLRYAREWMAGRRIDEVQEGQPMRTEMNRFYAIECTPTPTGAKADHRLPLTPRRIEQVTLKIAENFILGGAVFGMGADYLNADETRFVNVVVRDLGANRGGSVVIVGDEQPPAIHALGHAINAALGAVGNTVFYTETFADSVGRTSVNQATGANELSTPSQTNQPNQPSAPTVQPNAPANQASSSTDPNANRMSQMDGLRELVAEMNAGQVQILLVLGGNPVYTAPADLNFAGALERVPFRAHLSKYNDETSWLCDWHIPESHFLEAWSDVRAFDGTASIVQPLIEPLYGSKSAHEFIGAMSQTPDANGRDTVREYWRGQNPSGDFETFWRRILHDGVIPGTGYQPITPALTENFAGTRTGAPPQGGTQPRYTIGENRIDETLEIIFRPDHSIYDGRYSNNGWLQELPKPLSKITWDNAAVLSPATARRLGVGYDAVWSGGGNNSDVVELRLDGRTVRAPVWIQPGQPDNCVTVHLGYGRERAGRVGNEVGYNANLIRTSANPWQATGLEIAPTGERHVVASTQLHFLTEDREPVRVKTLAQYLADPEHAFAGHHADPPPDMSMYPQNEHSYTDENVPAWGMAIDIESCVGCNACVMACQSENNIPVVGKEQVLRSREMNWLRIDTYYKGSSSEEDIEQTMSNPQGPYFQPLMCVHCELAPCEPVCPVAATVHDAEGLNVMVYNRCIGTRYCSNNCPYKVRRFNYLLYQDWETPQYMMMRNPEVTVRSRGVMEKCTYCVQRIQWAKIESRKDNRQIADGEIVTACQAVCPSEAIVFGDIHDPNSRVSRTKRRGRNFSLLGELNTRPRTTYLGALRNPNPEIEPPAEQERRGHESPNTPAQPHSERHSEGTH